MARQRKDDGWIKISRKLMVDQDLWLSERFTKGQAWIDLLMMASWRTANGYQAGTVYTSILTLADRWRWSWRKVKRFLGELEGRRTIRTTNSRTNGTTILIEKWGKYQDGRRTNDTTNDTTNVTYYKNIKEKEKKGAESTQTADAASLGWKTDDPRVPIDYRKDFDSFEAYDRWKNR